MRALGAPIWAQSGRQPLVRVGVLELIWAAIASAAIGVALAASGRWIVPAALIAAVALAALGFLRPAAFLAIFLLTRPLLAAISDRPIVHGVASANASGAIALLIIGVFVVALVTSNALRSPAAATPFMVVIAMSALSAAYAFGTLGAVVGTEPASELVRLCALLSVYVLAANLFANVERARLLFRIVAASAVVPATIGVVQLIHGAPFVKELGVRRITSTLGGGPNSFAAYLALAAVLLIAASAGLPRSFRIPALGVVLTALVGTYSREGWVMLVIGVVLLGWRHRRLLVITSAVVAVGLVFAVPAVHNRVLPGKFAINARTTQSAGGYDSFTWRLGNWGDLLKQYEARPVTGYGLRSTIYVNPRRLVSRGAPSDGFAAHNMVIRILVEGGVLLLIPYIVLLATIIVIAARMAREHWELQQLGKAVLVLWIAVIVVGLGTDDPFANTTLMYALLALTGSLEGARRAIASKGGAARNRSKVNGEPGEVA